ncbi:uncharacterized protein PGTG_15554 [Puccinia graminis f. sp. tritici CRL 75-36-700-3]|uniref:Uncharacterized protein n=1 Tax=Puccinia graminis f. sp. tritici (strain CRL 75-36-700-3 / race SCCL) TaxID=418459 RepID=E3KYI4_PUCGT|nr:uncharacterized protein PGTG_15554 [Puccinia graminis f. sp. tritici CRL 75-36-700-3]EFP89375.1 hypothetical protein PGTG_15554 [Puccinia graminis f. sp. tritici CRL 75-36-700-3]
MDPVQQTNTTQAAIHPDLRTPTRAGTQRRTAMPTRAKAATLRTASHLMPAGPGVEEEGPGSPVVSRRRSYRRPSTNPRRRVTAPLSENRPLLDSPMSRRRSLDTQDNRITKRPREQENLSENRLNSLVAAFQFNMEQKIEFLHRHLAWEKESFNHQLEIDNRRIEWEKQIYDRELYPGNPQFEEEKQDFERRLNGEDGQFERNKETYSKDREKYEQDRAERVDGLLAVERCLPAKKQIISMGFRQMMASPSSFPTLMAPLVRPNEDRGRLSMQERIDLASMALPENNRQPDVASSDQQSVPSLEPTNDGQGEQREGPADQDQCSFVQVFQAYVDQKAQFYKLHTAWENEKLRLRRDLNRRKHEWEMERQARQRKADREEHEQRMKARQEEWEAQRRTLRLELEQLRDQALARQREEQRLGQLHPHHYNPVYQSGFF